MKGIANCDDGALALQCCKCNLCYSLSIAGVPFALIEGIVGVLLEFFLPIAV